MSLEPQKTQKTQNPKKLPKTAPLTPVLVIWEDAKLDTDYDGPLETVPGTIKLQCCGFLVKKNRKEVILAMDLDPDAKAVRFIFSIPAKMVLNIIELEHKNGPKDTENQQAK